MEKISVVIVGGGITGVAAALYAYQLGFRKIQLHEKSSRLGGILRDIEGDDGCIFFRGCQYINPKSPLFLTLDKSLFYSFEHRYASRTNFSGEIINRDDFAGPVVYSRGKHLNLGQPTSDTVTSRFGIYPLWLRSELEKIFVRYSDPSNSHFECITPFQMNRVLVADRVEDIAVLKKSMSLADEVYGLPRYFFGLQWDNSLLPLNGYNSFFENIEKYLIRLGVKVFTSSPVSIRSKDDHIVAFSQGQQINDSIDWLVWTANPIPLFTLFGYKAGNIPTRMKNIYYKIQVPIKSPFYIQVYDVDCPITRIFLYEDSVTVESLDHGYSSLQAVETVERITSDFGIKCSPKNILNITSCKENRFLTYSIEDYQTMRSLPEKLLKYNMICSPWYQYGRDQKLQAVFKSLDYLALSLYS